MKSQAKSSFGQCSTWTANLRRCSLRLKMLLLLRRDTDIFTASCPRYIYNLFFSGGIEDESEQSGPWRMQQFFRDPPPIFETSKSTFNSLTSNPPLCIHPDKIQRSMISFCAFSVEKFGVKSDPTKNEKAIFQASSKLA